MYMYVNVCNVETYVNMDISCIRLECSSECLSASAEIRFIQHMIRTYHKTIFEPFNHTKTGVLQEKHVAAYSVTRCS